MAVNPMNPNRVNPIVPIIPPGPLKREPFPKPVEKEKEISSEEVDTVDIIDTEDEPDIEGERLPGFTIQELAKIREGVKGLDDTISPEDAARRYGGSKK